MSDKQGMIKEQAVIEYQNNLGLQSDESEQKHKYKLLRKNQSKQSRSHCYHWKSHHNKKYLQFLVLNYDLFSLPLVEKRKNRLFIKMSRSIGRKTISQCHSHHRTMLEKYDNIDNIIKYLCLTFDTTETLIKQNRKVIEQNLTITRDEVQDKIKRQPADNDSINVQNENINKNKEPSEVKLLKQQDDYDYVFY